MRFSYNMKQISMSKTAEIADMALSLKEKGQKVQMSTRSGEFVELSNLVDEVGIDSARYYFLARKPEQALEFDIDLAKKTNKDNTTTINLPV